MMNNSDSMRGVLTSTELRELIKKSNTRGIVQIASHLGAITLTTLLMSQLINSYWFYCVAFFHGVLINYLYAAQHELSHNTVFTNKQANKLFCHLFGFLTFNPCIHDYTHHMRHHRYTNDWEKDSELQAREFYTLRSYLFELSGIGFWVSRIKDILGSSVGDTINYQITEKNENKIKLESRLHLFGYLSVLVISVITSSWLFMIYWIGPLLFTKWTHNLHNLIEHNGMSHSSNVLKNTRSVNAPKWWHWLCWNMQYHTIHHAFPMIPFHNLPLADKLIKDKFGDKPLSMGYFEFQKEMIKKLSQSPESEWPHDEIIVIKL